MLLWVAPAVAQAAMDSGVARQKVDLDEYRERLRKLQSRTHSVMSAIYAKARKKLARIVFVEGHHPKIQQAAQILREDGICEPILLGPVDTDPARPSRSSASRASDDASASSTRSTATSSGKLRGAPVGAAPAQGRHLRRGAADGPAARLLRVR